VHICKIGNHRTIADTDAQTHARETRQGCMTLTGVNAQNTIKY